MKQKLPVRFNFLHSALLMLGLAVSSMSFGQFLETFDNTSIPTGWTSYNNIGSSSANAFWEYGSGIGYAMAGTVEHTGNNGSYAWVDGSTPYPAIVTLESPNIASGTLLNPELRFWMKRNTTGQGVTVWNDFSVDVYDGTAWNNGMFTHSMETTNGAWEQFSVPLNTLTLTGNIKFRFNVSKVALPFPFYDDIAIDDVEIVSIAANDALPTAFITPSLPACNIDTTVTCEIFNNGVNDLTSVQIGWSINGVVQAPVSWSGTLTQYNADTVVVGSNGSISANDVIEVWTYNMNGNGPDDIPANDSISIDLQEGLAGIYTIGATGDYTDFSSAVNAIQTYGLCGAVVFEVEDGTYNEQISLEAYSTLNSTNTITFTSQNNDPTLVTLMYSSTGTNDNFTVNLDGANYITFDALTIQNLGASYSHVFEFQADAHHNTIKNCIITGPSVTTTSNLRALVYTNNFAGVDNNTFEDNVFNNGSYGMYWRGNSGNYMNNSIIRGNEFLDQYYYGIYTYYNEDMSVRDNHILSSNTYNFGYGIYFYYATTSEVVNNYVDADSDYFYYGIYSFQSQGDLTTWNNISGNRVRYGNYGIYLSNGVFTVLSNNTVMTANGAISGSRGFYVINGSVNQMFNNISVNNAGGYAMYLSGNPLYISDHNSFYSTGNNAFYAGSNITDLAGWQTATGFDSSSVVVADPLADSTTMAVCNDTLDGMGMPNAFLTADFEGDLLDASTPDIGADQFATPGSFTLGDDIVLCDGDTTSFAVSYFTTVVWNSSDTSNHFMATSPGTITVSVNGTCGSTNDTVIVSQQKYATTPAGANICANDSLVLDPNVNNGMYSWSTGESSNTIVVSAAGTYDVTVTDEDGCLSSSSTVVTQSPEVNLQDSVEFCQGASAFLDATISGTYMWDDGSTGQTRSVTASGTYTVTVTDPFNCVSTDQSVVTEVLDPVASFTHVRSFVTLTVTNTSQNIAHPSTTYLWDFGDGTTSTDENPAPHVYNLFNAIDTFDVSLTITNQCTNESDVQEVIIDYVSVEEITALNNVAMYPNPTNGVLNIDINVADASEFTMDVVNVSGQVILHKEFGTVSGQNNQVVDLSEVSAGVYFVKLKLNNESAVYRLIKE